MDNTLYLSASIIFGLVIGSFISMLSYRLPKMILEEKKDFNLWFPASHCTQCNHPITWWKNIPLLGFILAKGQCHQCKSKIPLRSPVIELISTLLTVATFLVFGYQPSTLFLLAFVLVCFCLILIDLSHYLLPDILTLPLLWLGLIANQSQLLTTPSEALWGAIIGYLFLWSLYWLVKLLRKKEAMGYGDFKLTAAIGAWLGWPYLSALLVMASFSGLIVGLLLAAFKIQPLEKPIAFGPFLAISALILLFFYDKIPPQFLLALN